MDDTNGQAGFVDAMSFVSTTFRGVPLSGETQDTGRAGTKIDYRDALSYKTFADEYLYPLKPVVIRAALEQWNALSRWTPEFFKEQFGDMTFGISETEYGQTGHTADRNSTFTMAYYIDRMMQSTADNPAPYFRRKSLSHMFPSLLQDIQPQLDYLRPNWLADSYLVKRVGQVLNPGADTYLFIGGTGSVFPVMHYDGAGTHAFLMQIFGQKQYVLYSPNQEHLLYPNPEKPNLSLVNSVDSPDLTKFPLFAKAIATTFVLNPGEILFIPARWWHTVKILTPSITLSVNLLNQSNWHELVNFVTMRQGNPWLSIASRIYLTAAGSRRFWRDKSRIQPV